MGKIQNKNLKKKNSNDLNNKEFKPKPKIKKGQVKIKSYQIDVQNKKKEIRKDRNQQFDEKYLKINPALIKCKVQRQTILFKKQTLLKKLKNQDKKEKKKDPNRVIEKHKEIEDKRELIEELQIEEEDQEVQNEEQIDEFSDYFTNKKQSKILMTTSTTPSGKMFGFLKEIKSVFGFCYYYPRQDFSIKQICEYSSNKGYSSVMVWRESRKKIKELILVNLPDGPTSIFKVTSDMLNQQIKHHANPTDHYPEVVINNFNSIVGRRIARQFASLFPRNPDFVGRTVCTFHNQRDFIFFRRHRYIFNNTGDNADLQEIGPRFTLKLIKLQKGIYDNVNGKIEFCVKTDMYQSRRKYYL